MKKGFDAIHTIGEKIRNSGKTLEEKNKMAYEIAQDILNNNSNDYLLKLHAQIVVMNYKRG